MPSKTLKRRNIQRKTRKQRGGGLRTYYYYSHDPIDKKQLNDVPEDFIKTDSKTRFVESKTDVFKEMDEGQRPGGWLLSKGSSWSILVKHLPRYDLRFNYAYKVTVDDSNLLIIDSFKKLTEFAQKYTIQQKYINWKAVARKYDGIIFDNYFAVKHIIHKKASDSRDKSKNSRGGTDYTKAREIFNDFLYDWFGYIYLNSAYIWRPSKVIKEWISVPMTEVPKDEQYQYYSSMNEPAHLTYRARNVLKEKLRSEMKTLAKEIEERDESFYRTEKRTKNLKENIMKEVMHPKRIAKVLGVNYNSLNNDSVPGNGSERSNWFNILDKAGY